MTNPVISVENLCKSYRLGQIGTGTFSRDLEVWWARVRGKPNPLLKIGQTDHGNSPDEAIWALKDVSFQVEQGEVLGIIGRNGAGKSTLLKILSRVTAPTSGRVKVKGRIASLLEVGTGFHPELTGRENIYLNGAILGMSKQEITRKFDEIVNFAEIEKFIDTPVKRYSSGMYVRLAFAVAAHLECEILLVDEVLAVGDLNFQKKCLGKMGDVARAEGRSVLFVSHNMAAIMMLCQKSLLLNNGTISEIGKTPSVIQSYTRTIENEVDKTDISGAGEFVNFKYIPRDIVADTRITVQARLVLKTVISDYKLFCILQDENSNLLMHNVIPGQSLYNELTPGFYEINIDIPPLGLKPGSYGLHLKLVSLLGKRIRIFSPVVPIEITYYVDNENLQGVINPKVNWTLVRK